MSCCRILSDVRVVLWMHKKAQASFTTARDHGSGAVHGKNCFIGGWIDMPLQRKRSIRRGGSGGEGRFISYILGNYIEHIGFFTLRCFKSSVEMFSQVLCYCMCKQTKFQDPSISCGTSPSQLQVKQNKLGYNTKLY